MNKFVKILIAVAVLFVLIVPLLFLFNTPLKTKLSAYFELNVVRQNQGLLDNMGSDIQVSSLDKRDPHLDFKNNILFYLKGQKIKTREIINCPKTNISELSSCIANLEDFFVYSTDEILFSSNRDVVPQSEIEGIHSSEVYKTNEKFFNYEFYVNQSENFFKIFKSAAISLEIQKVVGWGAWKFRSKNCELKEDSILLQYAPTFFTASNELYKNRMQFVNALIESATLIDVSVNQCLEQAKNVDQIKTCNALFVELTKTSQNKITSFVAKENQLGITTFFDKKWYVLEPVFKKCFPN